MNLRPFILMWGLTLALAASIAVHSVASIIVFGCLSFGYACFVAAN